MAKEITMDEIFEFTAHDIKLVDFCAILLGCADFLDGFLEYAKDHKNEDLTDGVLGEICSALMEFSTRRAPFNEYVHERTNELAKRPDIQEMLLRKNLKTKTIKS